MASRAYPQAPAVSEKARILHSDTLVFDAHVHMINRQFYRGGDIGDRLPDGQVDLPRAREGGLDAMFFTVYVTEQHYPARYETKQLLRLMDLAHRQIAANSRQIELALSATDVERIVGSGRIAALLDVEGGFDLDGDLGVLRQLYRLGLRVAQLPAHNWTNSFAESCCAKASYSGLTDHGKAVVREINRLGMIINVSHGSDLTIEQAIETSVHPVIATHHGLRSFNDIPRTMPEALLEKLARKGGIIGFHIGCEFHSRKFFDYRAKRDGRMFWDTRHIGEKEKQLTIEEIDERFRRPRRSGSRRNADPDDVKLSPEEWFAPVQRSIELVGEDHVALGSDLDGGPTLPRGMQDVRDLPRLTEAMLRLGWKEQRIRKFLGGNLLRLVRQVTQ